MAPSQQEIESYTAKGWRADDGGGNRRALPEEPAKGENDSVRVTLVHVPEINIREVRTKMGLSQAQFRHQVRLPARHAAQLGAR